MRHEPRALSSGRANEDHRVVRAKRGCTSGVLANTEEDRVSGGQGLQVDWEGRGTQLHAGEEERVEGQLPRLRRKYKGEKGQKRQERQKT